MAEFTCRCGTTIRIAPSKLKNRRACNMKCKFRTTQKVEWVCPVLHDGKPCGKVLVVAPHVARRRKACSTACRNTAKFATKEQTLNRARRVMFVFGYTKEQALAYLKGWKDGRGVGRKAHQRKQQGRMPLAKVGSEGWEKWLSRAATEVI